MEGLLQVFRRKFFLLFLILFAFIPLYPKFPLFGVSGTYVAVRFEDLLIFLVVSIWFLCNLQNLRKILRSTIFQVFLVFWVIGLLSLLSGIFITHSVIPHLGVLHLLRRIEMMMLFFIAYYAIKNKEQLITLLKVGFLVTTIIALYGLGQIFLQFPVVSTTNREFSKGLLLRLEGAARVNSTFAGHYDLAAFLSIILVFASGFFFFFKSYFVKVSIIIFSIVNFILLGLTAARVSFVGTIIGAALLFWFTGRKILIVVIILAAVAAIGLIPDLRHRLVATVTVNLLEGGGPKYTPTNQQLEVTKKEAYATQSSALQIMVATQSSESTSSGQEATSSGQDLASDIAPGEPLNTTELGVYRSFNIRLLVEWPRAIRAFVKNPLLGTGYSSLNIATDNDVLRSLGEVGLLGTLALALVFFVILKTQVSNLNNKTVLERTFILSTICAFIATIITGLFIDVLEASKIAAVFWMMLGVSYGVAKEYKQYD